MSPSINVTEKTEVDETFGLAGSLWPMMHSLADLLARHKHGKNVTSEAFLLEQLLLSWSVDRKREDSDVDDEAMWQIAQSYRLSGLLTLYSGSLLPSGSNLPCHRIEDTHRSAIDSLLRVCVLSGPMSTLTWPLYIVTMSSATFSDRTFLQHIFTKFLERQHMKGVEAARDKVLQMWGTDTKTGTRSGQDTPDVLLG